MWSELIGAQVEYVDARGVSTRVVTLGDPSHTPLVLLHGRGGHLETFVHNMAPLSRRRFVVALDLLGHGLTEQSGTNYDIGELYEHVWSVIQSLELDRFDVVGQSLGGWIAARLFLETERVASLVLIEPAGFQSEADRMADPKIREAAEKGGRAFDSPSTATVTLRLGQLLFDRSSIDDELVSLRTVLYSIPGAGEVHKAVRTADNSRWVLPVTAFEAAPGPVLIIRGEHGHIAESLLRRVADAAPDGELAVVSSAKQWPHYENPSMVNEAVALFLERKAA